MAGNFELRVLPPENTFILKNGRTPVEGYRLHFSIVGIGSYHVDIEKEGYTPERGKELIREEYNKIIQTME